MKTSRTGLWLLVTELALVSFCQSSEAACDPLSLCSCGVSASSVSFGSYSTLSSTPTDSVGTINVSCTLVVAIPGSFVISLSSGSSGGFAARTLTSGGSSLSYNLYTAADHAQVWGDGMGGSQTVIGTFLAVLATNQNFSVYGRIPASQNVAAGTYGDTIIVTVTY